MRTAVSRNWQKNYWQKNGESRQLTATTATRLDAGNQFGNNTTMASIIPTEFQPFASEAVASGRYRSEEELVSTALRLLEDRERKMSALRADLQIAIDESDRGDVIELGDAAARQIFFDDIKARGRRRMG